MGDWSIVKLKCIPFHTMLQDSGSCICLSWVFNNIAKEFNGGIMLLTDLCGSSHLAFLPFQGKWSFYSWEERAILLPQLWSPQVTLLLLGYCEHPLSLSRTSSSHTPLRRGGCPICASCGGSLCFLFSQAPSHGYIEFHYSPMKEIGWTSSWSLLERSKAIYIM